MIVLTTPTGNIGSKVLQKLLLAPGFHEPLRLIVRDPGKLIHPLPASVEVVHGQTDHLSTLQEALRGADTLFWCQPDTPTADDYVKAYDDWSRIALEAIASSGIPRVVAITGAGGEPGMPAGPATGLSIIEKNLMRSQASCRFLRCASFFSNILWEWDQITKDGVFAYSLPGDFKFSQVATDDIAHVAAHWLCDSSWSGKEAISLLGPEDISYDEIAAELSHQLGKPIRYKTLPESTYRERSIQIGLSPSAAQGLVDMFNYFATEYRHDSGADRSLTPTTFATWLRGVLASS